MLRVSNKPCIRALSKKSFSAAKARNRIAVLAIALTTLLFTALFTVGSSMNEAIQQFNFRQNGGRAHGSFHYLSQEQAMQLREDPLIKAWGASRVLGIAQNDTLRKTPVEVGYADAAKVHWSYLDPTEGRLPAEGTNEAATDLDVLRLLGVEPKLGTEFTVSVSVDGVLTQQTFTLCGWWEPDPIASTKHILVPESRINSVLEQQDAALPAPGKPAGSWTLDVMFQNASHIQEHLDDILTSHGYQSHTPSASNYISTGVNWSYTGARMSRSADGTTIAGVLALLLLIIFTGYLIIYNVFRISVVNDIRFYGLLKTIGTTGKQIKFMIRHQALSLCALGIPLGCLCGWLVGARLCPLIMSQLNGFQTDTLSTSPMIFILSALFTVLTVLLSCARPGRLAAKVSPIEAIRYTDGGACRKKQKKGSGVVSAFGMAWANLSRSKGKTFVTILSLTLAMLLLQMTMVFTNGFDTNKYLKDKVCDFILADSSYFRSNAANWDLGNSDLPEDIIAEIAAQGGVTEGGRIYGQLDGIQQFAPEDWIQSKLRSWGVSDDQIQYLSEHSEHTPDGRIMDDMKGYGMEPFALDTLTVIQGDLSALYQPGSHSIAAVYTSDDYGNPIPDSHWAELGDTVTLRFPVEWEWYNPETGEIYAAEEDAGSAPCWRRPSVYKDETFTVSALVTVPTTISYRYFGSDDFVLNAQDFRTLCEKSGVMLYAFNTEDSQEAGMEEFLRTYTTSTNLRYDYESNRVYMDEFNAFRMMFLTVGSLLALIVGLVGVLNFINAVLTGILTRKRELAMLQSIGMTGKQLKSMLAAEGLMYTLGSVTLTLVISLATSPLAASTLERTFWFFTYKPSMAAILVMAPIFALLGCVVPLLVYRHVSRQTIVERLRESES